MAKFSFRAKNWNGKTIKGIVEAQSEKGAVKLLKERELVVLSLELEKKGLFDQLQSLLHSRVSLSQMAGFTRQLATMISAGLPLTDALDLITKQVKGKLKLIVEESLAKVQAGDSLGKAFEQHQKIFGDVFIASVKAGEEGGVLEEVLLRLADNLEKKKEFYGKVKGALVYPIIVVIGMVLVSVVMMVFVIPKMTSLYAEFGTDLPLPTMILMGVANFVSGNIWALPIIVIGGVVGFKAFVSNPEGKKKVDELKLRIPISGPLTRSIALTEITRTLGILLGTGVPLVDTLEIVAEASGNEVYRQGLDRAAENVEKGVPFSEAIQENPAFPVIVSQMISTGEQTGKLGEVLANVSRYFEVESEEKVKGLTSAIEPLIMVVLGIGVGFLVIAVIMPIYNLTSQF